MSYLLPSSNLKTRKAPKKPLGLEEQYERAKFVSKTLLTVMLGGGVVLSWLAASLISSGRPSPQQPAMDASYYSTILSHK